MNSKQLNILLGVIAAVAVAAMVYMAWANSTVEAPIMPDTANSNTQANSEQVNTKPSEPEPAVTSNIYTNSKYGFQLTLPEGWIAKELGGILSFDSKDSFAKLEQNMKNCENPNPQNCNSEYFMQGVSFTNDSFLNNAIQGSITKHTINGTVFTKYWIDGMATLFFYEAKVNGQFYVFSSIREDQLDLLMKTFKLI